MLISRENETKKPAKRYNLSSTLMVTAKTIGTKLDFRMPVSNISVSGMLLTWDEPRRVPFAVNTILEVLVQPNDALKNRSLNCLAKVVHAGTTNEGRQKFGVKIIQADEDESQSWNEMITHLAAGHQTSESVSS